MTRLIGYIADDDGPAACGLMVKAAQSAVTQHLGVAPDCPSTISVISSSASDKDAFRLRKFDDGWNICGFSSAKHYSSCGG
jgi:hypothetical protein